MAGRYFDGRADEAGHRARAAGVRPGGHDLVARGITVNAVAPGSTATGPFAHLTAAQRAAAGSAFALGRIGEPADTAGLVAFLASADAAFVTGQIIYNAGGQRGPIRVG